MDSAFKAVRCVIVLAAGAALLAGPAAAQFRIDSQVSFQQATSRGHGQNRVVASAGGEYDWVIEETDVFGIQVDNVILFDADKRADGTISGRIFYRQKYLDNDFLFLLAVTCLELYDNGTRVKIGGVVEATNDPSVEGLFGWFQAFHQGGGLPAVSTVVGFGDEAANEAFCHSSNLPNFGPWPVDGKLNIERRHGNGNQGDGDDDDDDD